MSAFLRTSWVALRALLVLTVVCGVAYPLVVLGIGQGLLSSQANGSLLERDGTVVGSRLIGQDFDGSRWFHARPSAAGDKGWDLGASGGTNLAAGNAELTTAVEQRRAAVAEEESVPPREVPADAVTSSASGLDPDISPAYAALQVPRVAGANGLTEARVRVLVARSTSGGAISPATVNVVELNLAIGAAGGS